MAIEHFYDLEQGSDEWFAARCGVLTASEMKHVLTPTLKLANNDKTRQHVWELAAQRISNYVEPSYVGDAMLRGWEDEIEARIQYGEKYAPVLECGFITNDSFGCKIGYSPDGLVGDHGLIECKSRIQKYQVQTIVEHVRGDAIIPQEFELQLQTGLLVSGRKWVDFISYSAGLPMVTIRVLPDEAMQEALLNAAVEFEGKVKQAIADYEAATDDSSKLRLIPTERKVEGDII